MNWHSPKTFSQWILRWTSLANLVLFLAVVILPGMAIQKHWPEQILGAYLASQNANRPEKGAIWEAGQGISLAKAHIAGIIKNREELRLHVLGADSFAGLAAALSPGQCVKIEPETLLRLYQSLPEKKAAKFMDPLKLIWLIRARGASQILCQAKTSGMSIYFMEKDNQLLDVIDLSKDTIQDFQHTTNKQNLFLEQIPEFSRNIYPAPVFFKSALRLPKEMRSNLMENPDILMSQKGTLHRVGIANQSETGYVSVGFEFIHEKTPLVIRTRAKEWVIWQLGLFLQENAK